MIANSHAELAKREESDSSLRRLLSVFCVQCGRD
jgi:hypothetical protein